MVVRVIVVRHGERLDEADRMLWRNTRTAENAHDPPLTSTGWEQAQVAGRGIAKSLPENCPVTLYSSPTARTISTAAGLAASIGRDISTITPCYSLNCCAAAQTYGVAKGFPTREPDAATTGGLALACWPPMGDAGQVDKKQRSGGGFVESVKEIAASHTEGEVIVLVSHREGIWQLHRHVGTRGPNGYCNTSFFNYDLSSNSLTSWESVSKLARANATKSQTREASPGKCRPKVKPMQSLSPPKATPSETLEELLASGSGTVMIHRSGRGGCGTLLWRTPGVRGVWTEGGAVPDGELVSLQSSPQCSEGNEGDFVLVQRANGQAGWTKVKNVRIAP